MDWSLSFPLGLHVKIVSGDYSVRLVITLRLETRFLRTRSRDGANPLCCGRVDLVIRRPVSYIVGVNDVDDSLLTLDHHDKQFLFGWDNLVVFSSDLGKHASSRVHQLRLSSR